MWNGLLCHVPSWASHSPISYDALPAAGLRNWVDARALVRGLFFELPPALKKRVSSVQAEALDLKPPALTKEHGQELDEVLRAWNKRVQAAMSGIGTAMQQAGLEMDILDLPSTDQFQAGPHPPTRRPTRPRVACELL